MEENYSKEWPNLLVSFSESCFTTPALSITTDQLERSELIYSENDSLGGRELDNKTNNFSH